MLSTNIDSIKEVLQKEEQRLLGLSVNHRLDFVIEQLSEHSELLDKWECKDSHDIEEQIIEEFFGYLDNYINNNKNGDDEWNF